MNSIQYKKIELNGRKYCTRPFWIFRALKKRRYKWRILRSFSFQSISLWDIEIENQNNKWFLFERDNHSNIDYELSIHHTRMQEKQKEKDIAYSFLGLGLTNSTIPFVFRYTPKENDMLLIYIDEVANQLIYENKTWYMDNMNTYRNEEWDYWLINSGEVKIHN